MPAGAPDFANEYQEYLSRFTAACGDRDYGVFVKHEGRLVKKMRYEEFEPIYREYYEVAKTYFDSLDRGDTINDIVVKVLRERATDLFLKSPV